MTNTQESIVVGGGCFWCIEAAFRRVKGVSDVISGYAGGDMENPTYEAVTTGETGHAEVVKVVFNPEEVTLRNILRVFFTVHDPTTPDQQGADIGTQYRSIILTNSSEQAEIAREVIDELSDQEIWDDLVVTHIQPLDTFYPAEDYHQEYYEKNGQQGYCRVVIAPKIAKLRSELASLYREIED